MRSPSIVMSGIAVLVVAAGLACGGDRAAVAAALPLAEVHFETNATDRDVEVVFEVSGEGGLAELTITAPDGRTVVDFRAPDATIGMRKFKFESPEPPEVDELKVAYPEGTYRFAAKTVGGEELTAEANLSHTLPGEPEFMTPEEEAEGVSVEGLVVTWGAVEGAANYVVEVEIEDTNVNLLVMLPGDAPRFQMPDGFLRPGTEYKIGIGAVTSEGNRTFVETSFTTAE